MPPEPLPWDRRDFFKERKRERSSESIGSVSRWKEIPHHGREYFRTRPPGHGKQGGWHNFSQEPGHGFTPSRSNEKIFGDENCRPYGSRADGKFSRNSRENRGSFSQKDWRGQSWQNGSPPTGPGRPILVSDQRSVDDIMLYNSHPNSDSVNTSDQIHSKGQHDKKENVNGLVTGQRLEKENTMGSIDWKPLKWSRSGSLTSRGSGFSHSSSSKSIGVDSSEDNAELEPRDGTPVRSPSGDAVACATSAAPSEETNSRKKPRLGWGEGLAKYEKKKVDGPDDSATKNGMVVCVNKEPLRFHVPMLFDKSPRFTAISDCGSPGTPSSVGCSSSPGMEDKPPVKGENIDSGTGKLSGSPKLLSQNCVDGIAFNLENTEPIPIANSSSSLCELLQSDNSSTAMNKLLVWKAGPSPLQGECQATTCELVINTGGSLRPAPLQLVSSENIIAKEAIGGLEEAHCQLKDEDIDSPGTVTSKFVEPLCSVKTDVLSESVKHDGSNLDMDASKSGNQEVTCSVYGSNREKEESLSDCDSVGLLMASKSSAAPVGASLHSSREEKLYDLILASNKGSASKASDIKKKPELAGQGKLCSTNNYLVTSGKRWNREMNTSSLDMLGAAIAANGDDGRQSHQNCKSRFLMGETTIYRAPQGDDGIVQRSGNLDSFSNESERETVAADVLAGIYGSISSEAMSSCITSSFELGESYKDWKCQNVGSSTRRPLTPEVAQNIDDGTCSDESCGEMDPTHWTDEEKSIFIQAVSSYGKDFTMISRCVKTRSRDECIVFFSKARKCLGLDMVRSRPGNEKMPASDNSNGGGGDNEDACVVETGSVICTEISGSKIDEDMMLSDLNINHCESDPAETVNVQTDLNRLEESTVINGTGGIDCKNPELQSGIMVTEDWQADGKQELSFDGKSTRENGVDSTTVSVQACEDTVLLHDTSTGGDGVAVKGTLLSAEEANFHGPSLSAAEGEIIAVGLELEGQQLVLENNSNNKEEENGGASTSGPSDLNSSEDWHMKQKSSNLAAVTNSPVEFGGDPNQEPMISLEFNPSQKPYGISMEQIVPLTNANSPPSQHEKTLNPNTASTLDLEKISDKQSQKPASLEKISDKQSQSADTVLGCANSYQILRGYPLRLSTKKEVNGDSSSLQSYAKECLLQKCNSSQTQNSVAELPFLSQEQRIDHSQPPPCSLSDTEKPCRNGDLKLFGKILTYPKSQQQNEDISVNHENKDKGVQPPKLSSKTFNLKFNGTHSVDGNSVPPKLDHINYLGLENLPMRSYGYWDGTRIRTGFSSLPDSAILLAKYPAAFSNYSSSSDSEQQRLHSGARSNERNLNGVSVFSTREKSSSNGVADYPLYRNREGRVQPFTVDMKQRQEMLLSEMQRRNGFEVVSNIPQATTKGMVGINVVGRGGILVGACTTGVSDPVAAIKMHYAKADQYGGQTASIVREDESWRGKGDIGR
ncbi:duplicated homeodomain-like superfamily protein [Actinidia rufa]|uniref:Duplicated homeodomain-like superfamily protein n=1 Tax=Actinidia rufa TaxID=165716 RepID=A0A7J0EDK1_9ERIC|nr:duplicated homeodomain-like superfamily protein [Actinidia rufa]